MIKYLYIILFCSLSNAIEQKIENADSLVVIKVINRELYDILDHIIDHEKKCTYYSPDIMFDIYIFNSEDKKVGIQISTIGKVRYKLGYEKGIFKYKGHTFFVSGIIDNTIFSLTKKKIRYIYEEMKIKYSSDGDIIHDFGEDDSLSYWNYYYLDNSFLLDSVSTYCD